MTTNWIHNKHVPLWCILLLTVLVFSPTFNNGFQMGWDDQWMVTNILTTHPLNISYIITIFSSPFNGQWGPTNQLIYTILYVFFGYNPFFFHLYSLVVHVANICLVHFISMTILTDCTTFSLNRAKYISYITTLFFAIHPLQVESIAWISASKIILSSFFYLCATYSFISFIKHKNKWHYVSTIVLFICSYLSKENVLTFPLWAVMLCYIYKAYTKTSFFVCAIVPLFALTLLLGLHLIFYVTNYTELIHIETYSIGQRIILCCYSLLKYLFKWIMPFKLNWMYYFPVPFRSALPTWMGVCPYILLVMLTIFWRMEKRFIIWCGLLMFFIHLLFVLHLLVLPRNAIIAERYMYLPIIGLNLIFAYYLSPEKAIRVKHNTRVFVFGIITLLCAILTYNRTKQWNDSETLRKSNLTESTIKDAIKYQ